MFIEIKAIASEISSAAEKIQRELEKNKCDRKECVRVALLTEEILNRISEKNNGCDVKIAVKKKLSKSEISISFVGEEYRIENSDESLGIDLNCVEDAYAEGIIRDIVIKSSHDNVSTRYKNGVNRIRIAAGKNLSKHISLIAILAAIATGVLLKCLATDELNAVLATYVFGLLNTVIMNVIKLMIVPVVLFSIITSIMQFSDLSTVGRVGIKVLLTYFFTSVVAILIGWLFYNIFDPGIFGSAIGKPISDVGMSVSFYDTIVGIFPSNIISPLASADMLQIIFLSVFIGIGISKVKNGHETLVNGMSALYELTMALTKMIMSFVPLVTFTAIVNLILTTETSSILSLIKVPIASYTGILCMMMFYCLLLAVAGKLNPLKFIQKTKRHILLCVSTLSSAACIPSSMDRCEDLGVSKSVYSLSIPLGATINMDGTTIVFMVTGLAAAKISGYANLNWITLLTLMFTVMIVSLAAPGVPGAATAMAGFVLSVVGASEMALSLSMALITLAEMGSTANNVFGDIAATTLVAKSEGLLDIEKYNS